MATFNINCPHCGGALEVQDEWAGMETACPLCQTPFVIPRREPHPPAGRPSPPYARRQAGYGSAPAGMPGPGSGSPEPDAAERKALWTVRVLCIIAVCVLALEGGGLLIVFHILESAVRRPTPAKQESGGDGAVARVKGMFSGGADSVMKSELAFLASRGHAAGDYLKKVAPGRKVLIIAEPGFEKSAQITAMVDMIKKAYGSQDVTIAAIPVPATTEDNPQPIEEIMKAKDFDKLTNQYKDAGIIISLIGLPSNARSMKAFSADPAPKFFLLSTGIGTGKFIQEQMNKGVIVGAVVPNPKANYDLKAPADPAEAFAIRFVLVTKDNLDANKQFFE